MLPHALPLVGAFVLSALVLALPGRSAFTPEHRGEVGIGYMKLRLPGAEQALRAALAAAPTLPRARLALGMHLTAEKRFDEAIAVLEAARSAAGTSDLEPGLALGVALQLSGRTDAARGVLEDLGRRFPEDGRPAFNLAMLAIKGGDEAQARARLQEALGKTLPTDQMRLDAAVTLRNLKEAHTRPDAKQKGK
ncbi:MAG: tetratricopeptide repeat protein [Candidatus Sericytochromatia bacterium]|nr:tetratricopeptide repeat protein [Candidatus Sericytochromatia bacterium]